MAKLTGLKVGNFKAFGPTQNVPIRPITLIFGPNSSGKSSIIHSLALLSSGLEAQRIYGWDFHKTRLGGDAIDLGGFWNYRHRPINGDSVVIGAEHSFGDAPWDEIRRPEVRGASTTLAIGPCGKGLGQEDRFGIRTIIFSEEGKPSIVLTRYSHEDSDYQSEMTGIVFSLSSYNPDSELWQRVLRETGKEIMNAFRDRMEMELYNPMNADDYPFRKALQVFDWAGYVSKTLTDGKIGHKFGLLDNTFSHGGSYSSDTNSEEEQKVPEVDEELQKLLEKRQKQEEEQRKLEEEARKLDEELSKLSDKIKALVEENIDGEVLRQLEEEVRQFEEKKEDLHWSIQGCIQQQYTEDPMVMADGKAIRNWMKKDQVDDEPPIWLTESKLLQDQWIHQLRDSSLGNYLAKVFNEHFSAMTWTFSLEEDQFKSLEGDHKSFGPNMAYLGPLRTYPERHLYDTNIQEGNDKRLGDHEWMSLFNHTSVLEDVNLFLGEQFLDSEYQIGIKNYISTLELDSRTDRKIKYKDPQASWYGNEIISDSREIEKLREIQIYSRETGIALSNRDIGLGISQVLPVLITLSSNLNKVIAIEQPQLHLHPAMQASLGDVFIRSALQTGTPKEGTGTSRRKVTPGGESTKNQNTVILETHSEHLILRILRRIRQTTEGTLPKHLPGIRSEDVAVLYVKPEKEGARVIQIPVNDQGEFEEPWPGGFFPERLREFLGE